MLKVDSVPLAAVPFDDGHRLGRALRTLELDAVGEIVFAEVAGDSQLKRMIRFKLRRGKYKVPGAQCRFFLPGIGQCHIPGAGELVLRLSRQPHGRKHGARFIVIRHAANFHPLGANRTDLARGESETRIAAEAHAFCNPRIHFLTAVLRAMPGVALMPVFGHEVHGFRSRIVKHDAPIDAITDLIAILLRLEETGHAQPVPIRLTKRQFCEIFLRPGFTGHGTRR